MILSICLVLTFLLSSSSFVLHLNSFKLRFKNFAHKYIANQDEFNDAVVDLKQCTEIALDLEFDRDRYAYGTTLCLIQVNGNGKTYIFDPLSGIVLDDLYKGIIENAEIEKIVHAPSEDIRIIQMLGYYPSSIFDTERCAKLLNFQFTGLSTVVKEVLNVTLDKQQQTSNWLKRPLSDQQLAYAALDVVHLSDLKKKMVEMANDRGVLNWIEEENKSWSSFRAKENDGSSVSKKESKFLSDFELHCYNSLLGHRDKYSKLVNKPGYMVIPKEVLIEFVMTKNAHEKIILKNRRDVHPVIRKLSVEKEFDEILRKARLEAKELRLSLAIPKKVRDDNKEDKLAVLSSNYPQLHSHLVEKYGLQTANHVLPNRLMTELATNRVVIEDLPFEYKKNLFRHFLQNESRVNNQEK